MPSRLVQPGSREAASADAHIVGKKGEKKVRFEDHERAAGLAKLKEKSRISLDGVIVKDRRTGELLPFGEHHHHHPVLLQQQEIVENKTPVIHESEEVRLKGKLKWLFEQDRMFWESTDSRASSPKHVIDIDIATPNPFSDVQQPKDDPELCSRIKARNDEKIPNAAKGGNVTLNVGATGGDEDVEYGPRKGEGVQFEKNRVKPNPQSHKASEDHGRPWKCNDISELESFGIGARAIDRECSSPPMHSGEFRDAAGSFKESLGVERAPNFSRSEKMPTRRTSVSKEASDPKKPHKPALFDLSSQWYQGFNFGRKGLAHKEDEELGGEEIGGDDIIWRSSSKLQLPTRRNTVGSNHSIHKESNQQKTFAKPMNLSFRPTEAEEPGLVEAEISELDLGVGGGGDAHATDYEDADNSSPLWSSDDEDGINERNKVGAAGYVEEIRDRNTLLKAKCDLLSKEKEIAVRKWKRSCVEIEQAAQMAQALRSAIETLLEVSIGNDSSIDSKSKRTTLEAHTRTLKARMEKLRRKGAGGPAVDACKESERSPGVSAPSKGRKAEIDARKESERSPGVSAPSKGRKAEMSKKKSSGVRDFATPKVPRDTENNVEDLKARLEKLMLATNSRETEHVIPRPRDRKKKTTQGTLFREKTELKITDWYNSLSAELSGELIPQPNGSNIDKCDLSSESGQTIEHSCNLTPADSKQVSPQHRSRQGEDTASIQSTEETKIRVIHKIAEEVRAESEQWYQVQELLQRVGEDMKRLQEACDTWERRALLAEAQVETLLHEDQERKERPSTGDEKIAELRTEMVRLKDTVDEVRKQLVNVEPSRWFEAAHKFGYAFAPVIRPTSISADSSPRHHQHQCHSAADSGEVRESVEDRVRRELRQKQAMDCDSHKDHCQQQPSCSGSSTPVTERFRPIPAARRDHKLQSSQWAKEIARAEEDEIFLQSKMQARSDALQQVPRAAESKPGRAGSAPEEEASVLHSHQESVSAGATGEAKSLKLESNFADDNQFSSKDVPKDTVSPLVDTPSIPKDAAADDVLRNASLPSALTRSPLKVVLGNVASSKENKKPF
ncbi:hypothetical protein R1sor_017789 [Riccia sorocarpa]|uniref:Uncharacterized protein n=1 Tax=Riccia sorocarpa TaxID=122646 RepID=A0ABD3I7Y8_9MARC